MSAIPIQHFSCILQDLSRLHLVLNISNAKCCCWMSHFVPPPLLTPLVSPPHQIQATYFHFDGLPQFFLIPTPSPLTCRLNQSLPHTLKCFPSDNSAIHLLWHRRITPVKALNPSFITHISTVTCQQFNSRHLVCHHHCFSRVGTHCFFALSSCLVFFYMPVASGFILEL